MPEISEGQLTKLRSRLVSREGLKIHATNIGLGTYLMMGRGEEASGGRQRASILADAYEALVGAMYLDSNIEIVRRFVLDEALQDIQRLTQQPLEVNPKGQLQEILQAISPKSPKRPVSRYASNRKRMTANGRSGSGNRTCGKPGRSCSTAKRSARCGPTKMT